MLEIKPFYLAFSSAAGIAPVAEPWQEPQACSTFQPQPCFRRPPVVALGPCRASDLPTRGSREGGALLVLAGDVPDYTEARQAGFTVLDLWPLAGRWAQVGKHRARLGDAPEPTPEEAALLVGRALGATFERAARVVVYGPPWARRIAAGLPGAVVGPDELSGPVTCPARGLRWPSRAGSRWDLSRRAFEVAMSLAGEVEDDEDLPEEPAGEITLSVCFAYGGPWVPATWMHRGWRVPALGGLLQVEGGNEHEWRWPCAKDAWLRERVGAGEPLQAEAAA